MEKNLSQMPGAFNFIFVNKKKRKTAHTKNTLSHFLNIGMQKERRESGIERVTEQKQSVLAVAEWETKRTDSVKNKLVRNFLLTIRRGTIKIIKSSQ